MITITLEQFERQMQQNSREMANFMLNDLPVIVGKTARDYYTKNFQNEAWERQKWQEVQRRQSHTRAYRYSSSARRSRKILTGSTGNLGRSIQYKPARGSVEVFSDVEYAAVHNFGLRAGRGSGFTMPKRQFIGESEELNDIIKEEINNHLNKIFNK